MAGGHPGGDVLAAQDLLAAVRERLADDLDAPGALAVVDTWADAVLAAADQRAPGQQMATGGQPGADSTAAAGQLVRDTVDALLGIAL